MKTHLRVEPHMAFGMGFNASWLQKGPQRLLQSTGALGRREH